MPITYALEHNLDVSSFKRVLIASGLSERRPINDDLRLQNMLDNAQLIIVARDDSGVPVGVARSITDYAYCLYCSDLAVDKAHQGEGIGKALLAETVKAAPDVKSFLLVSAPAAVTFYERAGYERLPDAFRFHLNESI